MTLGYLFSSTVSISTPTHPHAPLLARATRTRCASWSAATMERQSGLIFYVLRHVRHRAAACEFCKGTSRLCAESYGIRVIIGVSSTGHGHHSSALMRWACGGEGFIMTFCELDRWGIAS